MTRSVIWSWRSVATVAAFIAALTVNSWFVKTGFEAKCVTEYARFRLPQEGSPSWHLDGASLRREVAGPSEEFTGDFEPSPSTTLTFERIGRGPLFIQVDAPRGKPNAATIREKHKQDENLGPSVYLTIEISNAAEEKGDPKFKAIEKRNMSLALPISGAAEIGNLLSDEVSSENPLLRSGTVRLLGRASVGGALFDAGSRELLLGDNLSFEPEASNGVGVLSAGDDSAFTVVYRVVGRAAVVRRFGAQDYKMRVSLYSRVAGDTSLQLIWAAVLVFTAGIRLILPDDKTGKSPVTKRIYASINQVPGLHVRRRIDATNEAAKRAKRQF